MDQNKFNAPQGPPPSYPQAPPQAQHYDAGPYQQNQWQQQNQFPQQGQWQQPSGYDQFGNQYPQGQNYYGQPNPMQYQNQQPYIVEQKKGPGASEGICAACLGIFACCCCLDILF